MRDPLAWTLHSYVVVKVSTLRGVEQDIVNIDKQLRMLHLICFWCFCSVFTEVATDTTPTRGIFTLPVSLFVSLRSPFGLLRNWVSLSWLPIRDSVSEAA